MRRTCNITALLKDNTNIFTINRKLYLEIGYTNKTKKYEDYPIIWFPQGVYTIASVSLSHSTSGTTVSLQIKDKMSLLDGSCGGTIPASTQFDSYETIDENGEIIISQPTIDQIIREAVNHFGGEQLSKIIISDINKRIKTVMKWIGNVPIYLINDNGSYSITTDYSKASQYSYQMFSYGDNIGYIYSDFVYSDDLIGDAGSDVTDILDKIVSYLGGNYEYFYDVYGNFIFQEIKNYLNTSQAKVELENLKNENYVVDMSKGKSVYNFKDNKIVISCSNSPQYLNVKNDYVVWGIRESAEGVSLPIRYHLAIDTKPKTGNIYKVFFYEDSDDGITKAKIPVGYSSYAEMVKTDGAQGVYYLDESTGNVYIWSEGSYTQIDVTFDRVMAND
jgi:hypothetical protein